MTKIKETIERLEELKKTHTEGDCEGECIQTDALSHAIEICQAVESVEGELKKKETKLIKDKIANILVISVFGFHLLTTKRQEERLCKTVEVLGELGKNIATPIIAKYKLENKQLKSENEVLREQNLEAVKENKQLRERVEELEKKLEELQKGENDWWRKRWLNKDGGKELFEIRKKYVASERARNIEQGAWEEVKKYQDENVKLKHELQSAKLELNEIKEFHKNIVGEKCGVGDELHCTCVPALRLRIDELEKACNIKDAFIKTSIEMYHNLENELQSAKSKILEMGYENIALSKRISELEDEILELKGVK